jgi:hypothetical protein
MKHLVDVCRWERMATGGANRLELPPLIGLRFRAPGRAQGTAHPFRHSLPPTPRSAPDFAHLCLVDDHLQARTHWHELNKLTCATYR